MCQRGFTVIEMLLVIAIVGILSTIATLQFSSMTRKSGIHTQIGTLYGNLMTARTQSLYKRATQTTVLTPSLFAAYSSAATNGSAVVQMTLKYAVSNSNNAASQQIIFDGFGAATGSPGIDPVNGLAVCVSGSNPAAYDSLVITSFRISMGKLTNGMGCTVANIVIQ